MKKRPVIKADHDGLHGAAPLNEHTPGTAMTGHSVALAGAWVSRVLTRPVSPHW
jgi:hypothetical protein